MKVFTTKTERQDLPAIDAPAFVKAILKRADRFNRINLNSNTIESIAKDLEITDSEAKEAIRDAQSGVNRLLLYLSGAIYAINPFLYCVAPDLGELSALRRSWIDALVADRLDVELRKKRAKQWKLAEEKKRAKRRLIVGRIDAQ